MNIIVLNYDGLPVTGGQVYDSSLYEAIQKISSHKIEYCQTKSYPSGLSIFKLLCPFLELTLLKTIKNFDICFSSSSVAYRDLLLLLITRIIYPRKRVYLIHHHYQFEGLFGIKKIIFKFFELSFLKLSTSIIIPSPFILNRTKELMPKKKVSYIEIAFKENVNSLEKINVNNGELLYIGTIEPRKGLHLLLDSLFKLKNENNNFIVNLIGKVIDNDYYLGLLEKVSLYGLGKHVVFHGRVSSEVLNNYLMSADLFVLPSVQEGYGMVLIEAMSYGIPVIAFNNSAMPFTIKDGYNGLLAKNEDTEDLKRLIEQVIHNPILRNHLRDGALMTYNSSRRDSDFIDDVKKLVSTF